jgi:hypothetical protein
VHAERDHLVAVGHGQAFGAHPLDELRRDIEDPERDQLAGVQVLQLLGLHLACELRGDVDTGHGELLLFIDVGEAQVAHGRGVVGIRGEQVDPRAHAIVQIALAIEPACLARHGELHVALAAHCQVQTLEGIERPVGGVLGLMTFAPVDQSEVHLAGLLGRHERPVAAV